MTPAVGPRFPAKATDRVRPLFTARSVALVGASGRRGSPYARPLDYLLRYGFPGAIHPVNPRYEQLHGLRCHRSLSDLPEAPDLVMVMVPAEQAAAVVTEAGQAGARSVIVCSSGFAETGYGGRELQETLTTAAREADVRLLGPNSQGLLYIPTGLAATFTGAAAVGLPEDTGVAYVGQSGAIGGCVLDLARETGMGLTAWVSTGNQADVTSIEVATELIEEPGIRVIMLYLESADDGPGYLSLLSRAAEQNKHLVVLRSGRSRAGRRAAASHTGAMVRPERAFDLVSLEYGAVLADDIDALISNAHVLSRLPRPRGRRVGIVTTSGGAGSLAADQCSAAGLTVEKLPEREQERLSTLIPPFGAVANPVDVTVALLSRDDDGFRDVCALVADSDSVDSLLVVVTTPVGALGERLAAQLIEVISGSRKPVLICWLAGHEQTSQGRARFRAARVPLFRSPGYAVQTLKALAARRRERPPRSSSAQPFPVLAWPPDPVITEADGLPLLDAAGVPRPPAEVVTTVTEAADAARRLGPAMAMKAQTPSLTHKTEAGAVYLNVAPRDAPDVFNRLESLLAEVGDSHGVLIQQMAPKGVELLVGVTAGEQGFPPVLTVGFGGVAAELYRDVASAVLPLTAAEVRRLLLSLRAAPMLTGYRNHPPVDVDAAVDAVSRLACLAEAAGPRLRELEVNPLVVTAHGAFAVDFLLRLDEERPTGETRSLGCHQSGETA